MSAFGTGRQPSSEASVGLPGEQKPYVRRSHMRSQPHCDKLRGSMKDWSAEIVRKKHMRRELVGCKDGKKNVRPEEKLSRRCMKTYDVVPRPSASQGNKGKKTHRDYYKG